MKKESIDSQEKRTGATDWGEIYQRLESDRGVMTRGPELNAKEKKRLLKSRAKTLARESKDESSEEDKLEVVEFVLTYENYGIESTHIREICPLPEITELPGTLPSLRGIVNFRGEILPVMDLKKFFDLPDKGLTDFNKIIILQGEGTEFGLLVDAVIGVRELTAKEIKTNLPTLNNIRAKYLLGVTRERLIIIDATKILSDKNVFVSEGRNTN